MDRIKLLLVDDHILFRESLSRMLTAEPDFEVVGECGEAAEALQILKQAPVDLVLLDFKLPEMRGTRVIAKAQKSGYNGNFLMLTAGMETTDMVEALKLGVSGVFLKHHTAGSLMRAIRLEATGEVWLDRKIVQLLANLIPEPEERSFRQSLTQREQQVLDGIIEGLTSRRIAQTLAISEGGVKSALQQLFEKIGVRSRAQLVRAALQGPIGKQT